MNYMMTLIKKRSKLLRLSEDGELSQSVKYIKKALNKVINKLYQEYKQKSLEKANKFITDVLISEFSGLLGSLHAIDSVKNIEDELKEDKLLKRDVENLISSITPYLPYLGLVSSGITVGKHVSNHMYNKSSTQMTLWAVEKLK